MTDEQNPHPVFLTMPVDPGGFIRFRVSSIYAIGETDTAECCYIFAGPSEDGWRIKLSQQQAEAMIAAAENVQTRKVTMEQIEKAAIAAMNIAQDSLEENDPSWNFRKNWDELPKWQRDELCDMQIAAFRAAGFEVEE